MTIFKEDPNYRKLLNYALRALAKRSLTSMEVREKLRKRPGFTFEIAETVLSRLKELSLINDENYIKIYIDNSLRLKPQGLFRIANKLKLKGIPHEDTKKIWESFAPSQYELAQNALNKIPNKRPDQKARFLASRGFSPDIIYKLLAQNGRSM